MSAQMCGFFKFWSVGSNNDFNQVFGANCLNLPAGYGTTAQRDGVLIEKCNFRLEIKNNSTISYLVQEYILENRWDTDIGAGQNLDLGFQYLNMFNQTLIATQSNYPPHVSLFDIPNMTSHYKITKGKKFTFRTGEIARRKLVPKKVEGRVHNPAVLLGNNLAFKAKYSRTLVWLVIGSIGHEQLSPSTVVRSEVEGLDWELFNHYQGRVIKQDYANGTVYSNNNIADLLNTVVGVRNGAHLTEARDYV